MTKHIFEATDIKNLHLKNRLWRSATHESLCDLKGHMTPEFYKLYDELAEGGVGCIITSATSVSESDDALPGCSRLWDDSLIPGHQKLIEIIHKHDCRVVVQLAFGNYYREGATTTEDVSIDDLTDEDIEYVQNLFEQAAARAVRCGYDGIEIHSAHGYFLSRFISPLHNHRKDGYGGTPENKAKMVIAIIQRIKKVAPSLHLSMKINCRDAKEGGLQEDESFAICQLCAAAGLDSIEVSGGDTLQTGVKVGKNDSYYRAFSTKLANTISIPVIEVGGHRSFETMEAILNEGVSYLSLSRPLLREPNLPHRWETGDHAPSKCVSCDQCLRILKGRCFFAEKEKQKK